RGDRSRRSRCPSRNRRSAPAIGPRSRSRGDNAPMRARAPAIAFLASLLLACGARDAAPAPPIAVSAATLPVPDPTLRVLVAGDVLPHRPRLVDPARIAGALAPIRPLFAG